MPRNDQPQNLGCAFADGEQAGVAVQAFDRIFGAVAVAAEDLDSVAAGSLRSFRRIQFGHRRFVGKRLAIIFEPGRPQNQQPRRFEFGRHIRQHVADGLIRANRLTKSPPFASIRGCGFHRGHAQANRHRADADPPAIQHLEELHKSAAFFAQQVFDGNAHVVKVNRVSRGAAQAHFMFGLTKFNARRVAWHDDRADATFAAVFIGHGGDNHMTSIGGVGDPHFRAVDHPFVAFAVGGCAG